mmetsp:Transcript_10604/g.31300  ORF Transcript_10604/g.31300 Transcript_10604/m.31300 type:complete len:274 (+) Transcript_10604:3479-4300(+)
MWLRGWRDCVNAIAGCVWGVLRGVFFIESGGGGRFHSVLDICLSVIDVGGTVRIGFHTANLGREAFQLVPRKFVVVVVIAAVLLHRRNHVHAPVALVVIVAAVVDAHAFQAGLASDPSLEHELAASPPGIAGWGLPLEDADHAAAFLGAEDVGGFFHKRVLSCRALRPPNKGGITRQIIVALALCIHNEGGIYRPIFIAPVLRPCAQGGIAHPQPFGCVFPLLLDLQERSRRQRRLELKVRNGVLSLEGVRALERASPRRRRRQLRQRRRASE